MISEREAFETCFKHWKDVGFDTDVEFDERTRSEWKEHPWIEIGLQNHWLEAWAYTNTLCDTSLRDDDDIKITFNGEELSRNLKLLDKSIHWFDITKVKRMYNISTKCAHFWIANPREINEHTTYSCIKCDEQSGFA
ncbi:MAG: hypothetical protein CMC93_00625 [Flavobacteriaceae bacterium]|nr:hypothetical protein [Flavobacteriaceae bacterium]|tara:strand:+ start:3817 stop:4227 length:411 start_codon:yes stop_codon:yes gene_type:complete